MFFAPFNLLWWVCLSFDNISVPNTVRFLFLFLLFASDTKLHTQPSWAGKSGQRGLWIYLQILSYSFLRIVFAIAGLEAFFSWKVKVLSFIIIILLRVQISMWCLYLVFLFYLSVLTSCFQLFSLIWILDCSMIAFPVFLVITLFIFYIRSWSVVFVVGMSFCVFRCGYFFL